MRRNVLLPLFLLLALLSAAPPPAAGSYDLARRIEKIIGSEPFFKKIRYGILVQDLTSRETVYSNHPDAALIPASNLKLLTAVMGFQYLGPDFTYRTSVYGPVPREGVLEGNLLLRGSGDPSFLYDFFQPTVLPLEMLAESLRKNGVRVIGGDLVADDSLFDREWTGEGWKKEYLLEDYASPTGALSLNGNIVQVTVTPGKVVLYPAASSLRVLRRSGSSYYTPLAIARKPGEDVITVTGRAPSSGSITSTVTVQNPTMFTATAFARILKKAGIRIAGRVRMIRLADEKDACLKLTELASVSSPPLLDIIRVMNKESDNYISQLILKTVAARELGLGSMENARRVCLDFFARAGVDSTGLYLADGCGLSRRNRITCRQLVGVLEYAGTQPYAQDFYSTLPSGGEGTMEGRLETVPVIAKTGSIKSNTTLSGYVLARNGRTYVFSILVNGHPSACWYVREIQDRIIKVLAGIS
jgi:D-alanyl-D-alanine carboxypeptidase/D-alanyl-D-alanine-endopeptidase (penicillin-binding protein 4)